MARFQMHMISFILTSDAIQGLKFVGYDRYFSASSGQFPIHSKHFANVSVSASDNLYNVKEKSENTKHSVAAHSIQNWMSLEVIQTNPLLSTNSCHSIRDECFSNFCLKTLREGDPTMHKAQCSSVGSFSHNYEILPHNQTNFPFSLVRLLSSGIHSALGFQYLKMAPVHHHHLHITRLNRPSSLKNLWDMVSDH